MYMNRCQQITGIVILYVLIACNDQNDSTGTVEEKSKIIRIDNETGWSYHDFFKLKKSVPLSDSVFIRSIDKLIFHADKILILDKPLKSVLRFSETGDFEMSIHSIGKGPEEYVDLSDFLVEPETNDILILGGDNSNEILRFSWEGDFKKRHKLAFSSNAFEFTERGFVFFCGNRLNTIAVTQDHKFYNVLFCNKKLKIIHKQLPIPSFWNGLQYLLEGKSPFCKYGEDIYCQMSLPHKTSIYKLQDSILTRHYYFDFGKDLNRVLTSSSNPVEINNEVLDQKIPSRLNNYFENDKLIYFVVMSGKKELCQILYYKKEEKVHSRCFKFGDTLMRKFRPVQYHGQGEFIVHVLDPFLMAKGGFEFELPEGLKDKVTLNSNPVLLFFDIK